MQNNLKATANFHLLFPLELQTKLRKRVFSVPPKEREKIWKNLDINTKEIEKAFLEMVRERNEFAKDKGYSSRVDIALDWFKISKEDFINFIKNTDKVINYCNQELFQADNLPQWFFSEFNIPCLTCQLPTFPFKTKEETFEQIVNKYSILNKVKTKIKIKMGEKSKMLYQKGSDNFEITIDQNNNSRHQIADLIHELSHVICYLQDFEQKINSFEKGAYLREKETIKTEFSILKELSVSLYKAILFNETLVLFQRTLFELELYQNPNQNLDQLYAKIFNKCYKNAKQEKNSLYLLDEHIIFSPFSSLPHTVAQTNYLLGII